MTKHTDIHELTNGTYEAVEFIQACAIRLPPGVLEDDREIEKVALVDNKIEVTLKGMTSFVVDRTEDTLNTCKVGTLVKCHGTLDVSVPYNRWYRLGLVKLIERTETGVTVEYTTKGGVTHRHTSSDPVLVNACHTELASHILKGGDDAEEEGYNELEWYERVSLRRHMYRQICNITKEEDMPRERDMPVWKLHNAFSARWGSKEGFPEGSLAECGIAKKVFSVRPVFRKFAAFRVRAIPLLVTTSKDIAELKTPIEQYTDVSTRQELATAVKADKTLSKARWDGMHDRSGNIPICVMRIVVECLNTEKIKAALDRQENKKVTNQTTGNEDGDE